MRKQVSYTNSIDIWGIGIMFLKKKIKKKIIKNKKIKKN
jgi:hypothetical protein